ncbi:hypothetical protein JTE90_003520, partial [Oedothorax gibbosus]
MKDLLKRVLGRALLSQEEMFTVLCDCESLMNSRPLTYISENNKDPVPLSPSMFLQDIQEWRTPDLDSVDQKSLNRRVKYRQALQKDLRNRFRPSQSAVTIDCETLLKSGNTKSKVYTVWPKSRVLDGKPVEVYCDMETDGGGWTVIQRRGNYLGAKDHFFQDWEAYKNGFGNVEEDFWL